jgi:hypothetical protein
MLRQAQDDDDTLRQAQDDDDTLGMMSFDRLRMIRMNDRPTIGVGKAVRDDGRRRDDDSGTAGRGATL